MSVRDWVSTQVDSIELTQQYSHAQENGYAVSANKALNMLEEANPLFRFLPVRDGTFIRLSVILSYPVNVTSSSTVVATLEAARDAKSPYVHLDPPYVRGKALADIGYQQDHPPDFSRWCCCE